MSPPHSTDSPEDYVKVQYDVVDAQEHDQLPQEHVATTTSPAIDSLFSPSYIAHLNEKLAHLEPQKIVEWAIITLPNLFQTTAFGLTGLVILDMISKISKEHAQAKKASQRPSISEPATAEEPQHLVPLIFLDTLHHFDETLDLAHRAATKYNAPLHVYKPQSCTTREEFAQRNGERLWETEPDIYDYLVKVEPARRAYAELGVQAYFTGRRRTQNGERSSIPIIELDKTTSPYMLKINALASWDYDTVLAYVQCNDVPYNALIDKGYKSIGDYHSTQPTRPGEGERDGRWRGQAKTECGLHKDYLKMRSGYLAAKKRKAAAKAAGVMELDAGMTA